MSKILSYTLVQSNGRDNYDHMGELTKYSRLDRYVIPVLFNNYYNYV